MSREVSREVSKEVSTSGPKEVSKELSKSGPKEVSKSGHKPFQIRTGQEVESYPLRILC